MPVDGTRCGPVPEGWPTPAGESELLDGGDDQAELFVSVAKAKAGRVSALAVQEGVQMHGGIGMTDEHDIGLYMKREVVLSELFGSPRFHAAGVAELSGY